MSVQNLIANQEIFKYLILGQSGGPTHWYFDLWSHGAGMAKKMTGRIVT